MDIEDTSLNSDYILPLNHNRDSVTPDSGLAPTKYDFRPAARTTTATHTTHLDQDRSGDFDPSAETREEIARRKRRRLNALNGNVSSLRSQQRDPEAAAAQLSWEYAAQMGISRVATLRFTDPAKREALARFAGRDNWPENYIRDCGRNIADVIGSARRGRGRRREERSLSYVEGAGGDKKERIRDPAGLEQDLANHPAARGCVACRQLQSDCSLLVDEREWPCEECAETGTSCELFIEPTVKDTCEDCQGRRKNRCSFKEVGARHDGACEQCRAAGITKCVAGPAPGTVRLRFTYDRNWEEEQLPRRRYVACTACRQDGRRCSLRTSADTPPCKCCAEKGDECTFVDIVREKRGEAILASSELSSASSRDEDDTGKAEKRKSATHFLTDCTGQIGIPTTISTSFAHPVRFLYPNKEACCFCTNAPPSFGPIGLGLRDSVLALEWIDGSGYSEIAGGHASNDGIAGTRMCPECTHAREQVIRCKHQGGLVRPYGLRVAAGGLGGTKGYNADEDSGQEQLSRLLGDEPADGDAWCGVCVAAAAFRCAGGGTGIVGGCGLMLCVNCAKELSTTYSMDVQSLVAGMERAAELGELDRPIGLRADAEFLRKDGLLMKNLKPS